LLLFCIIWLTEISSACTRRGCKPVIYQAAAQKIIIQQASAVLVAVLYYLGNMNSISMHYDERMQTINLPSSSANSHTTADQCSSYSCSCFCFILFGWRE
jgi:hypothetical protein